MIGELVNIDGVEYTVKEFSDTDDCVLIEDCDGNDMWVSLTTVFPAPTILQTYEGTEPGIINTNTITDAGGINWTDPTEQTLPAPTYQMPASNIQDYSTTPENRDFLDFFNHYTFNNPVSYKDTVMANVMEFYQWLQEEHKSLEEECGADLSPIIDKFEELLGSDIENHEKTTGSKL
jgi:hypothetical protein